MTKPARRRPSPLACGLTSALAIAAALTASAPAFAQAGPATQLQEIDVEAQAAPAGPVREDPKGPVQGYVATQTTTGGKTPAPLIETPASIAVIGAEQIRDQNAQSIGEATRYAPGIRSEQFGANSRLDFFTIRGFNAYDTGLFRDGLQLFSTAYANFRAEPFGLERIEILRGPASVLYGATSPGGLINLVSKRPTENPRHYVEQGIGSYGQVYTNFDLSGPLDPDKRWLYRFTGVGRQGGTQVDHSRDDRLYLAPSLTFRPDASTSITFLTSYQYDQSGTVGGFLPYYGTVRPTQIGGFFGRIPTRLNVSDYGVDNFQRHQALLGYEFEHRFDDVWTVRQNLRYDYLQVSDKRLYGNGYATPDQSQLSRFNFQTTPRVGLFTVDNQAEARVQTGALSHTFLFGLDYKNYNLHNNEAFVAGTNLDILSPLHYQPQALTSPYKVERTTLSQLGLYVQDQIKYDRFILSLSGRYDFANSHTDNRLSFARADRDDTAFSGKVALLYNSEIGLSPYVAYSNAFTPVVGTNASGDLFKPERSEEIEGGLKYQPNGWNSFVTASVFDLTRRNVQTVDPTNIFNQIQTGEQKSTGFEFQAVANPVDGLKIVAAYTIYDLRITKDTNPLLLHNLPVATPETFGSVYADYTIQDGMLKGLGFGAGLRYAGRSYADADNTARVPDYTLYDAGLHYDYKGWRVQATAQNVFDRKFVASCSTLNACFYGDRRKATLSASYRW